MNGEMMKADSQKEMDTASTMINEVRRTTSEDPEESKIPRILGIVKQFQVSRNLIPAIEGCNPEDRADKIPKIHVNQNEDLEGLVNYTESARIESEWTVEDGFMTAPVSFCSATVCNNTLKPWDEIKKTWQMWEGRPITFEHPDEMVVKNPTDIIGFLGNVEKDEENKRLKGELYVMKEPAEFNHQDENYWKTMLEALKDREEISIGYWAVPENEEGTYTDEFENELEYDETVTQILPDHIASVDKGACSPEQGCGIGVEEADAQISEPYEISEEELREAGIVFEEEDETMEDADEKKLTLLEKIHERLKSLGKSEVDQVSDDEKQELKKKENDSMNDEEEETEEESDEEDPQPEQSDCGDYEEELQNKMKRIEELQEKVGKLEAQLSDYEEKEMDELQEKAAQLTQIEREKLEGKEKHELKALIEGARAAQSREAEGQEDIGREMNNETGKNLRSPPGGSGGEADAGPEIIDLYEDPLEQD